jgi:hypothetical protein
MKAKIGDYVGFWEGNPEPTRGQVVHIFKMPNFYGDPDFYILAVPTGIDDIYEVREEYNVTKDPGEAPLEKSFDFVGTFTVAKVAIEVKAMNLKEAAEKARSGLFEWTSLENAGEIVSWSITEVENGDL